MGSQKSVRTRIVLKAAALGVAILATAAAGSSAARAADAPTTAPAAVLSPSPGTEPMAPGKFQPTWESLSQYQIPEWFRDAKFGIWAHWSAQCVPEEGDWYARGMYQEGSDDYQYQVAHYGHPSKVGFKDIDHLWHAEHWDPEKLMALYKRAGAQYFMSLANHHDNFDCFDSKYQPWNSVAVGPHKDIVGGWEKAARAVGLRFGVSVHCSRTWSWFEVAQGADKTGPLAGVPYDGKMTKADGKGLWWDGLDPQDLYAQNHVPGTGLDWDWNAKNGSSVPDQAYVDKFYNRTIDLINKYHPDLVYFDDTIVPLWPISDCGLHIAAHYYNANASWHGGENQAVMTGKGLSDLQRKCLVLDIERGLSDKIEPYPYQTDTCIGSWHYDRRVFEQHHYKTADLVIHMLADTVSKNGNLALSIPVRPDGTIDDDELAFLKEMASWMDVNKQAIIGTRPWTVCGEGPSTEADPKRKAGNFNEGNQKYTAADVRFTTKDNALYAILLGWPDGGAATIQSLGAAAAPHYGKVGQVELLGASGPLTFEQTDAALTVHLPAQAVGDHAYVLKVTPAM